MCSSHMLKQCDLDLGLLCTSVAWTPNFKWASNPVLLEFFSLNFFFVFAHLWVIDEVEPTYWIGSNSDFSVFYKPDLACPVCRQHPDNCHITGVMCLLGNVREGNSQRHRPGTRASIPTQLGNMVRIYQKVML